MQNVSQEDINPNRSKRFKYKEPGTVDEDIYPLMYQLQRKEYAQFKRGIKTHAIKKITDGPRKKLEDMIELRETILALGNDIAVRA